MEENTCDSFTSHCFSADDAKELRLFLDHNTKDRGALGSDLLQLLYGRAESQRNLNPHKWVRLSLIKGPFERYHK